MIVFTDHDACLCLGLEHSLYSASTAESSGSVLRVSQVSQILRRALNSSGQGSRPKVPLPGSLVGAERPSTSDGGATLHTELRAPLSSKAEVSGIQFLDLNVNASFYLLVAASDPFDLRLLARQQRKRIPSASRV